MPTTASEWLARNSDDLDQLEELIQEAGLPMGIVTELPTWTKERIVKHLQSTFEQSYWDDISAVTAGDAEQFLLQGLQEGWSIRRMATEMANSFAGSTQQYALRRATLIARTESGNALNGARREAIDGLAEMLGPEVPVKVSWLSVLGTTTRATHANLDGVPADKDGMWYLSGYRVPWPGHWTLPAGERCNCQCSCATEWGMMDPESYQLIQQYNERLEQYEAAAGELWEKFNLFHDVLGRFAPSRGSAASSSGEAKVEIGGRVNVLQDMEQGWSGLRSEYLMDISNRQDREGVLTITTKDQGELTAAASCRYSAGMHDVFVDFLTSKRPGYGARTMQAICSAAADKGYGVTLESAEGARGFYKRLGMRDKGGSLFSFNSQQAADFAKHGLAEKAKTWEQELEELEPDDGVFTVPPSEEKQPEENKEHGQ